MPRRRRRAGASSVAIEAERGLVMRVLLHSPKDMIAGALAFAAVSAIVANALFLQAGHHPAPMFGSVVALSAAAPAPASPLPRPRPVDAAMKPDAAPSESARRNPLCRPARPTTRSTCASARSTRARTDPRSAQPRRAAGTSSQPSVLKSSRLEFDPETVKTVLPPRTITSRLEGFVWRLRGVAPSSVSSMAHRIVSTCFAVRALWAARATFLILLMHLRAGSLLPQEKGNVKISNLELLLLFAAK